MKINTPLDMVELFKGTDFEFHHKDNKGVITFTPSQYQASVTFKNGSCYFTAHGSGSTIVFDSATTTANMIFFTRRDCDSGYHVFPMGFE
jgi:hypothetical protein